jgi:4'-phosphopantetheinyl transferase EntD
MAPGKASLMSPAVQNREPSPREGTTLAANCRDLAATASNFFQIPLSMATAERPVELPRLSSTERELLDGIGVPARRSRWRRGRAALKELLSELGRSEDTTGLGFPHPSYSLTHARTTALALGSRSTSPLGLGIDLEYLRPAPAAAAPFFLTPDEQDWLNDRPAGERSRDLLRLWTVKEALFKSDPANAGTLLRDYRLSDPSRLNGRCVRDAAFELRYLTFELPRAFVSVAASTPTAHSHPEDRHAQ